MDVVNFDKEVLLPTTTTDWARHHAITQALAGCIAGLPVEAGLGYAPAVVSGCREELRPGSGGASGEEVEEVVVIGGGYLSVGGALYRFEESPAELPYLVLRHRKYPRVYNGVTYYPFEAWWCALAATNATGGDPLSAGGEVAQALGLWGEVAGRRLLAPPKPPVGAWVNIAGDSGNSQLSVGFTVFRARLHRDTLVELNLQINIEAEEGNNMGSYPLTNALPSIFSPEGGERVSPIMLRIGNGIGIGSITVNGSVVSAMLPEVGANGDYSIEGTVFYSL